MNQGIIGARAIAEPPGLIVAGALAPKSVERRQSDRDADRRSLLDFIPYRMHAPILARASTANIGAYAQLAIDDAHDRGGGSILAPPGTYLTEERFDLRPGVFLDGAGMDATILKVAITDISLIGNHSDGQSGVGGIRDLTVWGYGDRDESVDDPLVGEGRKLCSIGPFERTIYERVRAVYSRHMGLGARGERVDVIGCEVLRNHRDAINVSDCKHAVVEGNLIDRCGDDAIAIHLTGSTTPVTYEKSAVVKGNRFYRSFGIKLLGARNAEIIGNHGRYWIGYGIMCGRDASYPDTNGTQFNLTIQGNNLTDGVNGSLVGAGAENTAILVINARGLGSDANAIAAHIGAYDSGAFVLPEPYINLHGETQPYTSGRNTSIVGNNVIQTLGKKLDGTAAAVWSDFGFGQLWNNAGDLDPAIATTIRTCVGIGVDGDCQNLVIEANNLNGVADSIRFKNLTTDGIKNGRVVNNGIFRCLNGPSVVASSTLHLPGLTIESNDINLDPYHESGQRTSPLNGTWSATSDVGYIAFGMDNVVGATITRNKIRHVKRCLSAGTFILNYHDNDLYWDWSGTARGIGSLGIQYGQNHYFINCDPTSADYGKPSATADSAFVKYSAGGGAPSYAPSITGYYYAGQFVACRPPIRDGSERMIKGWHRVTSGNGSTVNTDWYVEYADTRTKIFNSKTWDPGSVTPAAPVTTTLTMTGAQVGDICESAFSQPLGGLLLHAEITSANEATAYLTQPDTDASGVDIGSGTLRVWARRSS